MKNTILSFLLILFTTNAFSQENPIIYFDYVTVLNTDVEKHIEAEKNVFSKMHKEQIDMGNKIGWDMWQISNNSYGEPTTTFLYVHIQPGSGFSNEPSKIFSPTSPNFFSSFMILLCLGLSSIQTVISLGFLFVALL